jgi:hypothetical protein
MLSVESLTGMSRSQRGRPCLGLQSSECFASTRARVSRGLCEEAAAQRGVLELEQWTSLLLGRIWAHRTLRSGDAPVDVMLAAGTPLLESFVEVGGSIAKTALATMGGLDRGGLGRAAAQLAGTLDARIPDWIEDVGTAEVVRAFADRSPGEGEALLLEVQPGHGTPHMIAVFVDARLGGMAKRLGLTRVVDPLQSDPQRLDTGGPAPRFRPVDPALASREVRVAIALTDATCHPEVGEDFVGHRALAIARVDQAGPPRDQARLR